MSEVVEDTINGAGASFTLDGHALTRSFVVSELGGNKHSMMITAASDPGIPRLGSWHPAWPVLYLDRLRATPISDSACRVTCFYKTREGMDITFGTTENVTPNASRASHSSVQAVTTYVDVHGDLLEVPRVDYPSQQGELSVLRPEPSKSFTLTLSFDPAELQNLFVGKVNIAPWTADPQSTPRQWLCMAINGSSEDGGVTYPTEFHFQKKIEPPTYNWDVAIPWRDPTTARPVAGATIGDGIAVYQMYPEIDFNLLGF